MTFSVSTRGKSRIVSLRWAIISESLFTIDRRTLLSSIRERHARYTTGDSDDPSNYLQRNAVFVRKGEKHHVFTRVEQHPICARAAQGCAVLWIYKRDIRVRRAKDRGTAVTEAGVPKGRYSTMYYTVGFAVAPLFSGFVYQRRKYSAAPEASWSTTMLYLLLE